MNIVIYARFSSHSQNEQSIEGQLKVCYEFAKRNNYKVVGEYIDRAASGTDAEKRPEFQRMINDSVKFKFSAVLVYQLDRFSRNRYDSAIYKGKLKKNGIRVISAKENISDDASGVLMEAVLEGMAEYYSVELSQKIKRGMDINAEKCLCTGGGLALGYKVNDNKEFVIDDDTAHIVKRIFNMYISGKTMAEIIHYLNENQIKTSRGNEYNKNSILRILSNKKYIGTYTYNNKEIENGVPKIINDDIFKQANIQREKNKKAPARAKAIGENYILTTKIFCGHCNDAMTGISGTAKSGKLHQYYRCVTNRKKGSCDKKTVKKQVIEDKIISEITAILNSDKINAIAKKVVEYSDKESNTESIKYIKKQLKENELATNNLIKALESGKAFDVIATQIEKRQTEKSELELSLAREQILSLSLTHEQVVLFLNKLKNGDINDIKYRQDLVDVFINKVILYDDKVEIFCNVSEYKIEKPLNELKGSSKGRLSLEVEKDATDFSKGVEPTRKINLNANL